MPESSSPLQTLPEKDTGDETQRRYRYQAVNAALLSLSLLDSTSDIIELFCEWHEDLLIRKRDGSFIGVQVKSRKHGLGPFTLSDGEIWDSLIKFVKIDRKFPDKFSRYVIRSSCGFWERKKNFHNPVFFIEKIIDCTDFNHVSSELIELITDMANESESSQLFVYAVLRKVVLEKSPEYDRGDGFLMEKIA